MKRITITITEDAYKRLEQHRKDLYPEYKKVSRMLLEIAMDETRDIDRQDRENVK